MEALQTRVCDNFVTEKSLMIQQSGTVSGTTPETSPSVKRAKSKGKTPLQVWKEVTRAKVRLQSMRVMKREEQGYNVDECYVRKIRHQGRSGRRQDDKDKKIIKLAMDIKIQDQSENLKALKDSKAEARKDLMSLLGKNTMKYRRAVDKLNLLGRKIRQDEEGNFAKKITNLKKKHQEARKERDTL